MACQDTKNPDYFHQVVDCQWACPAHTNVPEYIRLIAQERYADAYMLNRDSNVFPGILGRVCDRPCEPACRRGRVEDKPVAICRLKRVAYDYRGDIKERLPQAPQQGNGRRVALVGSGPAALTVANDLLPLGYAVELFEKGPKAGGAMRASVPGFRLPEAVLEGELGYILNMGVKVHYNSPVERLSSLLEQGFDAVFVGTGAPKGRDLVLSGLEQCRAAVLIGLDFLASVAFEHNPKVGERVVVIGGGNTAMDCCRTAKRLGAKQVVVVAPEQYEQMLASPWEKEDANEEGIEFVNNLLPKAYNLTADGRLAGITFTHLSRCYDQNMRWDPKPSGQADVNLAADTVILAIGQDTAYSFVDQASGVRFGARKMPELDPVSFQSTNPKIFFGGDAAFGPKNIITAVAHGHEAALSIDLYLRGMNPQQRPAKSMSLKSQKMGIHEWSYKNDYHGLKRSAMPHVPLAKRFDTLTTEVELGFSLTDALNEASRCLNCDVQTVFKDSLCIECDACIDICPVDCLSLVPDLKGEDLKATLNAPMLNSSQHLFVSEPLAQTARVMAKDENFCLHCGLCAERCPTGAWDMQKFSLTLPKAGS